MLQKIGYSYQRLKTRSLSGTTQIKQNEQLHKRKQFLEYCINHLSGKNVEYFSFDESGFDHKVSKLYGFCPKGMSAVVKPSYIVDRKRYSLVSMISNSGKVFYGVHQGYTCSKTIYNFIETLPKRDSKSFVLMDNAAIHKGL